MIFLKEAQYLKTVFVMFIPQEPFKLKHTKNMDVCTIFDTLVREMDWGDVVSTIEDVLTEIKVEAEGPLNSLLGLPLPTAVPGSAILEFSGITAQQTDILNEGHCGYEHRSAVLKYFEEPSAPEVYIRQAKDKEKKTLCSQNTIWSQDVYNQEVGCHPGQVILNLH